MLLTCPNCETIFRVDSQNLNPEGQTVRCSVCAHVWFASMPKAAARSSSKKRKSGRSKKWLIAPLLLLLVIGALLGGAIHQRVPLTAYLPGLIPVFDVVGLTIRPSIAILEVVDLQASHAGDNLRLGGGLRNNSGLRTHSTDLLVTVTGPDGAILNERVLKAEDRFIEAGGVTSFFAQMTVDKSDEATITVVPIGSRIFE